MLPIQKCVHCKRAMAPRIYPGTPKRFCSTKCRTAAHRKAARDMRPNEFYTPSHIIELVRASMGGIDLDPATCWTFGPLWGVSPIRGTFDSENGKDDERGTCSRSIARPPNLIVTVLSLGSLYRTND